MPPKNVLVIWVRVIGYCFEFRASIFEFLSNERESLCWPLIEALLKPQVLRVVADWCFASWSQLLTSVFE